MRCRLTLRRSFVAAGDQRRDDHHRPDADGDDPVQALLHTGPSVALGLAITLAATLTLTPALLVLLARFRPRAFEGFTSASSGLWDRLGRVAMARPLRSWAWSPCSAMLPLAVVGLQTALRAWTC